MITVYGDSHGCFTCAAVKHLLSKSKLSYRFYELGVDFTMETFHDLPVEEGVSLLPVIFKDGREITLSELERELLDQS